MGDSHVVSPCPGTPANKRVVAKNLETNINILVSGVTSASTRGHSRDAITVDAR